MRRITILTMLAVSLASLTIAGAALAKAEVTNIAQTTSGTTESISEEGCQNGGTCTDRVMGSISGKPVQNPRAESIKGKPAGIVGTVSADYSDPQPGPEPDTFSVPASGKLVLTDVRGANDGRLFISIVDGTLIGQNDGSEATLKATFTIDRGTGKYKGASGRGRTVADVVDEGETSTFTSTIRGYLRTKSLRQ
jgi:hypothetical protein